MLLDRKWTEPVSTEPARGERPAWLPTLRRYLFFVAVANLLWEGAHLPLYTLWETGSQSEMAFAVLHCTGGDVLIALSALMLALFLVGSSGWPVDRYRPVAALAIALGLAYGVFSEWLNIEIRQSWAYRDLMPVIPVIDTGLSPFLQWLVIPLVGFWWAGRAVADDAQSKLILNGKESPNG